MSENKETLKLVEETDKLLTEEDIADIDALTREKAPYFTVLKAWQETLAPLEQESAKKPTADWAAVIISKWPFLQFSDLMSVHGHYFRILKDLKNILDAEINSDKDALTYTTIEEDVENNKDHYVSIIKDWQKALIAEQSKWDVSAEDAGPRMAALGEVQQQLLGKNGLVSYLGVIQLPFSDEEQFEMDDELEAFRKTLDEER